MEVPYLIYLDSSSLHEYPESLRRCSRRLLIPSKSTLGPHGDPGSISPSADLDPLCSLASVRSRSSHPNTKLRIEKRGEGGDVMGYCIRTDICGWADRVGDDLLFNLELTPLPPLLQRQPPTPRPQIPSHACATGVRHTGSVAPHHATSIALHSARLSPPPVRKIELPIGVKSEIAPFIRLFTMDCPWGYLRFGARSRAQVVWFCNVS